MRADLSHKKLLGRIGELKPPAKCTRLERAAAVAIVLWYRQPSPEVLLMRRARRRGDPWSGQISLPGGRAEREDSDVVATAVRETHEEVGLHLDTNARVIGAIDAIRPVPRGLARPLHITPVVFELLQPQPLQLGDEAVRAFWLPLAEAASGALDSEHTHKVGPISKQWPCWRHDGEVVWGLTYHILGSLLALARET